MTTSPAASDARAAAATLLAGAARIGIVTHVNPDGDALGSLLGLGLALTRLGKTTLLACDDGVPGAFQFLPLAATVVKVPPADSALDLLVLVDCGDFARGGQAALALATEGRPILNIDHHVTNTRFGLVNWVDAGANSTAELILDLLAALGVAPDAEIATCLMTGLLTDTQGFRTSNVNARALAAGARLAEAGAPVGLLAEITLNRRSVRALCLWGQSLAAMQLELPGLLWTHVTQAMRRACAIPEGGEGNLSSMLLSAEEAAITAVFIERVDEKVEISFRAKPGFDVSGVAKALGGGGHPPAAGCMLPGSLADVEARVLPELRAALKAQQALRAAEQAAGSQQQPRQ